MTGTRRRSIVLGGVGVAALGLLAAVAVASSAESAPMLEVHHAPARFARRSGDLSANITGASLPRAELRYRVNGGPWQPIAREAPRSPSPMWTIELLPEALRAGANRVEIEASALGRGTASETITFEYDPSPLRLPIVQDWSGLLDVQDGKWEVVGDPGERRVRPVPGTERYDGIVLASASFAGGRRVETEMTFRSFASSKIWAGFGVISMWGGHHDRDHRPRRGWRYAIAWYMKPYGPWLEFSSKLAGEPRHDAFVGATWPEPAPGSRWSLIAEAWPETDEQGRHLGHRQRMKLWPAGEPEPVDWLEIAESDEAQLPPGEYAVALVAHECQVEFAPVRISALPSRVRGR